MSMSKTIFRELLDKEASPALGCTEPMMFALAGAITRKHAPGKVLRVDMVGCGLMVTGVQAVGIPNTGGKTGAFLASAVGIVNGDAEACKEVLHNIRPEDVVAAEELIQNAEFTLDMNRLQPANDKPAVTQLEPARITSTSPLLIAAFPSAIIG